MTADILRLAGNGNGANLRRVYYDGVEVTDYADATPEIHRLVGNGIERMLAGTLTSIMIEHDRTKARRTISLAGAPGALQLFVHEVMKP